ncbi:MAG: polymer-forming cytoskeletal protein [Fibrobacter sp.]|nr:polymer-forming cytoskeletal protein [Fibrobacter sp.]
MDKGNKGLYTIIGEGTVFEGTINVPHSLRIDGSFKGKIETTEVITIGNNGIVEADIIAKSAIIGGKVIGNLSVKDRVELEANSSLRGDLKTRDLVINEGAVFHGNCSMPKIEAESE